MIRIAFAAFLLAALPAAAQELEPAPPALRADVTVSGDLVRIGDLVERAGLAADVAVFRAPDPGTTGTVPVEQVTDALRRHGVIGFETRGLSEISVTRTGRAIPARDIEDKVAQAIAAQMGARDWKTIGVTFDRELRPLHVETGAGDIAVSRVSLDRRSGRFDVSFDLPSRLGARRNALRLTGGAAEIYEAIVVTRPLARGEILREADVATERRPRSEMVPELVAGPDAAIGQAAKRALRPGQPLRASDLMRPELVQRNEPVLILYEAPGLSLTLRGKALDSGAEGETVSVLNIQSKRTVHGVVVAPGQVAIGAVAQAAPPRFASASDIRR